VKSNIVASGSSGNAIILENGICLDMGIPYKKIKPYLKDIKIIFISHLHSDHCLNSCIKKIALEKPNIKFITNQVNAPHLVELGVAKKNVFALELEKWYDIGLCKVRLEYLIHDKSNCALKIDQNGYKLIYIVDTASVDHIEAKDYDYALIEANYLDEEELNRKIEEDKLENRFSHYERVKNTHLSQLSAINWLQKNNIVNYTFIHEHKEKERENEDF
jgi:hypothetical protein